MGTGASLVLIAGMAAVTYATRAPLFLLSFRRVRLPRLVELILEYVPAAAFAAIVVPDVFSPGGHLRLAFSNFYFYAAVAAVVSALITRSMLATIVVGVASAVLLKQVFG
jgi:branched-subunit amino acid transport protein